MKSNSRHPFVEGATLAGEIIGLAAGSAGAGL